MQEFWKNGLMPGKPCSLYIADHKFLNQYSFLIFAGMKKAFLQLHAAVFLAGFTAILGKLIGLNEGWLVFDRLLLTVIILYGLLIWRKEWVTLERADALKTGLVGLIIAIHWVTFYGSIKYANASVALVCLSASGFFTALAEPLITGKKIVWAELGLGLLAIAGIYIIFDFHPEFKTGIIFGIIAALGSAIFPIFNKQLVRRIHPRVLTFYELSGGLIAMCLLLPLYLYMFPAAYYLPTWADLGWLLILVVFCTVISFEMQLNSLKHISAFTANLTYNLEPVYGIILAFMVFRENKYLHNQFFAGVGLILLAVILQMLRVRKQVKSGAHR